MLKAEQARPGQGISAAEDRLANPDTEARHWQAIVEKAMGVTIECGVRHRAAMREGGH